MQHSKPVTRGADVDAGNIMAPSKTGMTRDMTLAIHGFF